MSTQGVLPYWEVRGRGLGPHIKFGAKLGARSGQVHQIRGKTWEVLLSQETKIVKKSQCWGHIWNSEDKIWGICHLYFWRQNLGIQQEFQRQISGAKLPEVEVPPWECQKNNWNVKKGNMQKMFRIVSKICIFIFTNDN